jgi:hypothetical protein
MNSQYSQSALLHRDWYLYNKNTLDCTQILVTAPKTVQIEQNIVLQSHGLKPNASRYNTVIYSQKNLLEAGSGCLAGGADAAQQVAETASSLNVSLFTASELKTLLQENDAKIMCIGFGVKHHGGVFPKGVGVFPPAASSSSSGGIHVTDLDVVGGQDDGIGGNSIVDVVVADLDVDVAVLGWVVVCIVPRRGD